MKIALASDHGGLGLKRVLMEHLEKNGYDLVDFGTYSKDSCDYPIFARKAAMAVSNGECDRGIVICSTGIGVSIVANKVHGIRCALVTDVTTARLTREHNDSNVLALGQKNVSFDRAIEIADIWLTTPFSGDERHQRRINLIEE